MSAIMEVDNRCPGRIPVSSAFQVLEKHFENKPHQGQSLDTRSNALKLAMPDAPHHLFLEADNSQQISVPDHEPIISVVAPFDPAGEAYAWEVAYSTTRNDIVWEASRINLFDLLALKTWTPGDKWTPGQSNL